MRALVILIGLAGCGDVAFGGRCGANRHCDKGAICDMTDPAGPRAPPAVPSTPSVLFPPSRLESTIANATQIDTAVAAVDRRPAGVAAISCGGSRVGSSDLLRLETDTATSTKPFVNLFDPAS